MNQSNRSHGEEKKMLIVMVGGGREYERKHNGGIACKDWAKRVQFGVKERRCALTHRKLAGTVHSRLLPWDHLTNSKVRPGT